MWSSWTRDRTCVPCTGRQILNPWTTREAQACFSWSAIPPGSKWPPYSLWCPLPEPCKINFVSYTGYIFYTRCSSTFLLNLVTIHLVTFTWYGDKWKLNNENADNNIRNSVDIKDMETNAKPWQSWRKFCENFHEICVSDPGRGIWSSGGQSWYYLLDYSLHLELCRKLLGRAPKDIYLRISFQE